MSVRLVLFDLDGTLADTAPDLAAVANRQRSERGLEPLAVEDLRPYASQGARGMIGRALGITPQQPEFEALRDQFFAYYEAALCVHTQLFDGMAETLAALEANGVRWGIVTNKVARFTLPLLDALALRDRAACVVSGDTTPHAKPHPAPLLHALQRCGVDAAAAIYVGDDLRDIQAGRAAAVRTVAALYGYLGGDTSVTTWGADNVIEAPRELIALLGL
ncbi:MAG TPA: phosphoglycolate phosphatase [Burkholderiaceae bacterium]|nr:phosphoglycolate phosphatase [Burkholderiaceae bacterium]